MSFVSSQVSGLSLWAAGLALSPCSAFKFLVLRVVGEKLSKCGLEILKALPAKQKYKYKHLNSFVFKSMTFARCETRLDEPWRALVSGTWLVWKLLGASRSDWNLVRVGKWSRGCSCSVHLEFVVGSISCTRWGRKNSTPRYYLWFWHPKCFGCQATQRGYFL